MSSRSKRSSTRKRGGARKQPVIPPSDQRTAIIQEEAGGSDDRVGAMEQASGSKDPPEFTTKSDRDKQTLGDITRDPSPKSHCSRHGSHHSSRSRSTNASSAVRKHQLELQAAEDRAKIRKIAIEERERLELELIDKRLELATAEVDAEGEEERSRNSTGSRVRSIATVRSWLANSVKEQNEPIVPATNVDNLTHALTETTHAVQDRVASDNTTRQLLTRLASGRDLPPFNGDALEWPGFKRAFNVSTSISGFSEEENLMRLYACLRGEARDAVASMMIAATSVKEIMEVLQLRFGSQTAIGQKIAQEIRRLPKLDVGRSNLITFATKVKNCVAAMQAANHIGYLHSPELAAEIMSKMSSAIIHHYNRYLHEKREVEEPRLVTLSKFLFLEAEMACKAGTGNLITQVERRQPDEQADNVRRGRSVDGLRQRGAVFATTSRECDYQSPSRRDAFGKRRRGLNRCGYCGSGQHLLTKCSRFISQPVRMRWEWAKEKGLCFKCLTERHRRNRCRAKKCQQPGCGRAHHRLLHPISSSSTIASETYRGPTNEQQPAAVTNTWTGETRRVLLKVVPVRIQGPHKSVETYALLDEGSTVTLIDADIAEEIGADGTATSLSLQGVNAMEARNILSKRIDCAISGISGLNHDIKGARMVPHLSLSLQTLQEEDVNRNHLKDLDIRCYADVAPKVLIGQDHWHLITSLELRTAGRNAPVASRTELGWTIHGYAHNHLKQNLKHTTLAPVNSCHLRNTENQHKCCHEDENKEDDLHALVKANFNLEAIGVTCHSRTDEFVKRAEHILESTTRRIGNRWETGLLWKDDITNLPYNKQAAINRLRNLERRMDKNPTYCDAYTAQIEHFIKSGYACKVEDLQNVGNQVWYLPHFAVVNSNKPGKLRLVFDAAARTQGVSLNDKLLCGPDLLNSLLGVLMRFRQRSVAITGDIKEMFLQIKIRPEDTHAQRFLWRGRDRNRQPDEYAMTSLIFGAASSPCSAQFVKNRNAREFEAEFPDAAQAIVHKHYVDDYLDSVNSVEEAIKMIRDITHIHRRGGFEIRGWSSNNPQVLDAIPASKLCEKIVCLDLDNYPGERILGIKWDPIRDILSFDLNIKKIPDELAKGSKRPTKRQMLRVIMSVFDPQGFLTPFTIRSKILLQDVWRSGIGWDDFLQERDFIEWQKWITGLTQLPKCTIPRHYFHQDETPEKIELHVFCDASEKAFATVAYWRYVSDNGKINIAFIAGKSRVAPLKPLSIPRLELQAAVLAGRLAKTIVKEHEVKPSARIFWTDSCTVLQWIHSDPRKYKSFVAHRLGELDEITDSAEWKWVPTKLNPADDATRSNGKVPLPTDRWFRGPCFLLQNEKQWPTRQNRISRSNYNEERFVETVMTNIEETNLELPDINRFSSWLRLIRSTAWILAFKERCLNRIQAKLTVDLLRKAEQLWIRKAQQESFGPELRAARRSLPIACDSSIRNLSPYVDNNGILRSEGRIKAAEEVSDNAKAPAILHGRHPYTRLLTLHYHQLYGHGGHETIVNELRQKYWVVNIRPTIRLVARNCQWCRIQKAKPLYPRMGDLPIARMGHHKRPFSYCGIDYFGPMEVTIGRRREKRWCVLFTCLTTRAIHLELANSLTTDSAIMALRRMASRRGWPTEIYSDNATNLRGANTELKRAIQELDSDPLVTAATSYGLKWNFIPPSAPHMGGSWERLVRCVKTALKITLKERAPKEEVLATLITEAEHTVNTRPLTYVSVNHEDQESLTPNHFLIGASSGSTVPGRFTNDDLCPRKQWRVSQRLADIFWSRWVREYLPTLLPRKRWCRETSPLKQGDIVLIADHTMPRNVWPRGIITQLFPGRDGRVRVVEVRIGNRTLKRPVVKVIALPTAD